jgi:hypothetical protein
VNDLFPEVAPDPAGLIRRQVFARHQHAQIDDATNNERYTLRPTLEQCMRLAGVTRIHRDVAACPEAHCAPIWCGLQPDGSFIDGLTESWAVDGVPSSELVTWGNWPYSDLLAWVCRTWRACFNGEHGRALALPPADRCEQPWWQKWVEPFRDGRGELEGWTIDTFNLAGRQRFGSPGDPKGLTADQAPFPSVLLVWRKTAPP